MRRSCFLQKILVGCIAGMAFFYTFAEADRTGHPFHSFSDPHGTLVRQVFYPALRRALKLVAPEPGPYASMKGTKAVKRALAVDQSPIGRTPRSVPATFLGVWDEVRKLFAALPEAKTRGYTAARFSFNTASGGPSASSVPCRESR